MKLLFKERLFSWLDSYDVYDEEGAVAFTVKGRLALGHCLEIYDKYGEHVGTVKEELLTLLPRFAIYKGDTYIGEIRKKLSFLRPVYTLDYSDWEVQGNIWEWDYRVTNGLGQEVLYVSKQLFNFTDTYILELSDPQNTLLSLMIVLAIVAAQC
ncbi:MAG: hypothetical protein RSD07_09170 [Angelakisella sp.]